MEDNGRRSGNAGPKDAPAWKELVAKYETPSTGRATWQTVNTLVPYFVLWCLMDRSLEASSWVTFPLVILAAGFLVRTFVLFHDCGHGSLFKSRKANDALGFITGVLTFTCYRDWRHQHGIHHATAGNLDKRGAGDIYTMTVREYMEAPPRGRFMYRLARNPWFLFILAPILMFAFRQRYPTAQAGRREHRAVQATNLAILVMGAGMSWAFGARDYLLLQTAVLWPAAATGMWLFYMQHQFEGVYWERAARWDFVKVAFEGSSYYKLPKVLQWFTSNIGFHHIHHLGPRIPNYRLEACQKENPVFEAVKPLTPAASLKCLSLRLYDEECRRLVGFAHVNTVHQTGRGSEKQKRMGDG
ncbi:MAG: fatty acid desaturase [Elusimicrobia bacterium]|nr:fatty acid desaturase [Elusimicrobiota bacterium]